MTNGFVSVTGRQSANSIDALISAFVAFCANPATMTMRYASVRLACGVMFVRRPSIWPLVSSIAAGAE
jgi:hypothetical protein